MPRPAAADLPSDWDVNKNWADSGVFALTSTLKPTTANEFRYSYTYWSNTNNPPTAAECPAPCIGLGCPNFSIVRRLQLHHRKCHERAAEPHSAPPHLCR